LNDGSSKLSTGYHPIGRSRNVLCLQITFDGEKFAFGHKKVRADAVDGFFGGFSENGGGAGGWARELLQPPRR